MRKVQVPAPALLRAEVQLRADKLRARPPRVTRSMATRLATTVPARDSHPRTVRAWARPAMPSAPPAWARAPLAPSTAAECRVRPRLPADKPRPERPQRLRWGLSRFYEQRASA